VILLSIASPGATFQGLPGLMLACDQKAMLVAVWRAVSRAHNPEAKSSGVVDVAFLNDFGRPGPVVVISRGALS